MPARARPAVPPIPASRPVALALLLLALPGCAITSHATIPAHLGVVRSSADLAAVIDLPGPVTVETVNSADWIVERSGLINLDSPAARAAHLADGPEPIEVQFHALRHPGKGLFLVDTGIERALRDNPGTSAFAGLVASYMKLDRSKPRAPLGDWLAAQPDRVAGVFITHMHPDHMTGMADVPAGTPVFVGPGESRARAASNVVLGPDMDHALAGKAPIEEWRFGADPAGRFDGVLDVFGDGTVWALWVPGHTVGSTAFVVRTPTGPVLLTGDACHTRWGWEHDVEPGSFSLDRPRSRKSLGHLRALAAEHPKLDVRFGHQR